MFCLYRHRIILAAVGYERLAFRHARIMQPVDADRATSSETREMLEPPEGASPTTIKPGCSRTYVCGISPPFM